MLPSLLYNPQRTTQNQQGQSKRDTGRPRLAQSAVVPNTGKGTNAETRPRVSEGKSACLANKPGSKTQTAKGTTFDYMPSTRKRLRSSVFSQTASSVICSSWRSGTSRQYATYIARWKRYANKRGIHSVSPSVSEGVHILGMLFNAGLSFSAICVARSALSSYLDCKRVSL